uniref:Small ribosomal subunit protein bS1c n=1 Tax=Rhodosorus marinus TaxID=101924 RepID=A0A7S3EKQ8_9RHOD|mmetsp:Transcript_43644/g.170785  ORF Transcript_43644/g.170785 Transcript_43644/m.170785 type:complete len:1842 (+) Transcript_43644:107-5632(+)
MAKEDSAVGLLPRGGGDHGAFARSGSAVKRRRERDENIFSDTRKRKESDRAGSQKKSSKKKRKHSAEGEADDASTGRIFRGTISQLSEGVLLLGVIKSIRRNSIEVSLPFNLVGYLKSDELMIEDEGFPSDSLIDLPDPVEEVGTRPLAGVLSVGDVIPVAVANIGKSKTGRKQTELTLDLKVLNRGLSWPQLTKGFQLFGCVKSKEEHGYVISLGGHVPFAAFLPFEKCENGGKLHVGAPLWCIVDESIPSGKRKRSVRVSALKEEVVSALTDVHEGMALSNIRAGALVKGSITKYKSDGLAMSFMSIFNGSVDGVHFSPSNDKNELTVGKKVQARVIYVDVSLKRVALSLNEKLVSSLSPPFIDESFAVGSIFEDAIVQRVVPDHGLYLAISSAPETLLFAHISRVSDARVENIAKMYRVGQTARCRVLGHAAVDGVVNVSLQESVLERVALRYADIDSGSIATAVVVKLTREGCLVRVDDFFDGMISPEHLSDVRMVKRAKEKFAPGAKIPCRIISVDQSRRRVLLSAKKSIVRAELPFLTSYEQAKSNISQLCVGFVVARTPANGVLVGFGNQVRGLIPSAELGIMPVKKASQLEDQFPDGRTLKVRIRSCVPSEKRLLLSLKKTSSDSASSSANSARLSVGQIVAGRVAEVTEQGITISAKIPNSEESLDCWLPMEHLADTLSLSKRLFEHYKSIRPEDESEPVLLEGAMVLRTGASGDVPTLTMKPSLISAWSEKALPQSLADLESLMSKQLVGYVLRMAPNAAIVAFAGGATGFVRKSRLSDEFVPEMQKFLYIGQTVYVRVEELNVAENRLSLTMRKSDMELPNDRVKIRVQQFFARYEHVQEVEASTKALGSPSKGQPNEKLVVGAVVGAKVKSKSTSGVLFELPSAADETPVIGFAVQAQVGDRDVEVGAPASLVVLDHDIGRGIADVSLKPLLVDAGKAGPRTMQDSQDYQAVVELVKEDIAVLSVPQMGHHIAHALSRDLNETEMKHSRLRPGMRVSARACGSVRGLYQIMDIEKLPLSEKSHARADGPVQELALGAQVSGKISSVHPLQVNLAFGKAGVGRIHITEAVHLGSSGTLNKSPLKGLTVGTRLSARVVSIRNEDAHVVELSMREDSPTSNPSLFWEGIETGKKLKGYLKSISNHVLWIAFTPSLAGRLSLLDTDKSLAEMNRGEAFKGLKTGDPIETFIASHDKDKGRIDCSIVPVTKGVREGSVVVEMDRILEGDGIRVKLPGHILHEHRYGHISLTDIADDFDEVRSRIEHLRGQNFLECFMLPRADGDNDRVRLSLRESRVSGKSADVVDRELVFVSDLTVGQSIRGFVKSTTSKGCFVSIGTDLVARVLLSNLSDHFVKNVERSFPPGKLISGRIQSLDKESKHVELTLRMDMTEGTVNGRPVSDLPDGCFVSGVIKSITDFGVFIRLSDSVTGLCHKSQLSDVRVEDIGQKFSPGQRVRAKVLKVDLGRKRISLSMKPSVLKDDPGESAGATEQGNGNDLDKDLEGNVDNDDDEESEAIEEEDDDDEDDNDEFGPDVEDNEALAVPDGFEFSEDEEEGDTAQAKPRFENGTEHSSESEDDEKEVSDDGHERKKKSSKEKRERKRALAKHEVEMRAKEEALQASMETPVTSEDFERLLMGTPNSSILWIKYIALRLSLSQLGSAREIAERALKTINYRDEAQRFNVWISIVNMEANYGTQDSFTEAYERACKNVDSKALHLRLITGLWKNKEYFENIMSNALKKFKSSKKMWYFEDPSFFPREPLNILNSPFTTVIGSRPGNTDLRRERLTRQENCLSKRYSLWSGESTYLRFQRLRSWSTSKADMIQEFTRIHIIR